MKEERSFLSYSVCVNLLENLTTIPYFRVIIER